MRLLWMLTSISCLSCKNVGDSGTKKNKIVNSNGIDRAQNACIRKSMWIAIINSVKLPRAVIKNPTMLIMPRTLRCNQRIHWHAWAKKFNVLLMNESIDLYALQWNDGTILTEVINTASAYEIELLSLAVQRILKSNIQYLMRFNL